MRRKHYGISIAGTGSYAPAKVLTNHDLESIVDTSDEWIRTRTGIRERHIAAEDEPTSALAYQAAKNALETAEMSADNIELIIVATLSPDTPFPNTACHLQQRLRAGKAACFSLEAACSGFIYALEVAAGMIRSGTFTNALVIGAEKISMHVDWTDRSTCVLFGDGSGAVVLKRVPEEQDALLSSKLAADGNYTDLLTVPAGGSAMPLNPERYQKGLQYIKMSGREVFKLAVNAMVETSNAVLEDANLKVQDIRWLVPHQANDRIIQAVGRKLGMESDRVFVNLDRFGNTSAATIPIAIDEIVRGGLIQKNDYMLLTAFGGGLTWGSSLLRW